MSARIWGIATLIAVLCCAQSLGQTTQPTTPNRDVPTNWQETISNLARTLTEGSDDSQAVNALGALIPDEASILRFASSDPESRYSLRQLCGGLSVVSARAYVWPMETFASDLTTDLHNCEQVPDTVKQTFTPRGDAESKRANATAQQWAGALLHPAAGEFVAVIFLWQAPPPLETRLLLNTVAAPIDEKPPVFVLVKGRKSDDDQIKLTHVVFGDAKQALN